MAKWGKMGFGFAEVLFRSEKENKKSFFFSFSLTYFVLLPTKHQKKENEIKNSRLV